jgi:oxygen tolerance protein BatD
MRNVISILVSVLFIGTAAAQSVAFYARSDAKQILENGVFNVRFSVRNAEGKNIKFPDFKDFKVISGPGRETSIQITNGKRTSSITYRFTLMATRTGKFVIGPATVEVGKRTYKSNPLEIEVVKGKPGSTVQGTVMPTDEQVFMRAEMDTTGIYSGQQVRIDYKVYTAVNIRSYNALKEDDYAGFHYRYVRDYNSRAYSEVIDGVQYKVQTLKSIALFSKKVGIFHIEPFIINVGIGVKDNRRSFFFNNRAIPKTVTSNALNFEVLPLPEPAPADFTGAVGHYAMSARVKPVQLTTDDALTLTVKFAGDGDAKRWSVPTLDYLSSRFEIYEPRIKSDKSIDERGVVMNRREVEYLMIPRNAGTQRFTVDFVYFNSDSARYETMRSRPITINVKQGSGVKGISTIIDNGSGVQELHPLQSPEKLRKASPLFLFSPLFFALCVVPFFYLGYVVRDERKKGEYAGLSPEERRKLEARSRAMKFLEGAMELMEASDSEFYQAISDALFAYISGKLQIPASELSKDNVSARMTSLGIDEVNRSKVLSIIARCEQVLYAAGSAISERQKTYDEVVAVIVGIEEVLG